MRVIDEWQSFIHTHFQTDGEQLPTERVREIERVLLPTLRRLGIVFGFHFERGPKDPGIRIVLECRPGEKELRVIRQTLVDTLRPIPRRPRPTVVRFASESTIRSTGEADAAKERDPTALPSHKTPQTTKGAVFRDSGSTRE
ncbi:MAG: hypothetical protein N3C12_03145 [Candidatus Binatia bacterium]|nr:hypothetical protein [Candidatus Binatia bacterium]